MDARASTPLDVAVAELARRQHGVVGHAQLIALGMGRGAIEWRLRNGRLHRLYVGVYAVGHTRLTAEGRRMAAVLACGEDALLSHATAAAAWDLRRTSSPRIHVTAPVQRRREGVVVHRSEILRPQDVSVVNGIPTTSVARTLQDLAPVLDARAMRLLVERSMRLRLFDRTAALDVPAGREQRRLRLAIAAADAAEVRSVLESDFLALCRTHGLRRPAVNTLFHGVEVDFLWRDVHLVVEVDGYGFHKEYQRFRDDRRKDVHLKSRGATVLRFTYEDVHEDAATTAAYVRSCGGGA